MGRCLTILLDHLHPDWASDQQKTVKVQEAPRGFFPGDPVWAKNYASATEWQSAKVLHLTGPKSYEVSTEDGQTLRRHIDQLRSRLPMDPRECRETEINIDLSELQ